MIKKPYITPEISAITSRSTILAGSDTLEYTKKGEYADPEAEVL